MDALAQIVYALKRLPACDHHLAHREQRFQCALLGLPLPPACSSAVASLEIGGTSGAAGAQMCNDIVQLPAMLRDPVRAELPAHPMRIEHAMTHECEVLDRQ